MSVRKTTIDLISFGLGGALFGLTAVVMTIRLLEYNSLPQVLVNLMTATLAMLCVIGLLYILFRRIFFERTTSTQLKSLPELVEDSFRGLDNVSLKDVYLAKFSGSELKLKEVAVWYASSKARLAIIRAAIAIVGAIALFYSAKILIDQLGLMRVQTENLNKQLTALISQNLNFEKQLKLEENSSRNQRITDLVMLLYDDERSSVVKSMALTELSKLDSQYLILDGADLKNVKTSSLLLTNKSIVKAMFDGADLNDANMSTSNLNSSSFNNAVLDNANLYKSTLNGASLNGAKLADVFGAGARFSGANLSGAVSERSTFVNAFFGSEFEPAPVCNVPNSASLIMRFSAKSGNVHVESVSEKTNLADIVFFHDRLTFANFDGANMIGATITGAHMSQTSGRKTDLSNSKLWGVDLRESNFRGASFNNSEELKGVEFHKSNLDQTSWHGATFNKVNFSGASLRCANFTDAIVKPLYREQEGIAIVFAGADLRKSKGLTTEFLSHSCGDEKTRLPDEFSQITLKECNSNYWKLSRPVIFDKNEYSPFMTMPLFMNPKRRTQLRGYLEELEIFSAPE